jgi:hypothetical protein
LGQVAGTNIGETVKRVSSILGLLENIRVGLHFADKSDAQYLRGAGAILVVSGAAIAAGLAIHRFQMWALPLAGVLGILVVAGGFSSFIADPWQPHTFTILVPMAAILVWASTPATWLEFKRQGANAQ